ncbi:DUF6207 family protein [Streptomyces sp. NPDC006692]|uniref:DUF6207 family protein n=1 Tax=unclassified Streptomyces TaxID=2593676 RepID=UPI00369E3237
MKPIDSMHVSEPALVVLDITAADEATALAVQSELSGGGRRPASPPYGVNPGRRE